MAHDFNVGIDGMDAVDFLIGEHRAVDALFARFEDLRGSDDAAAKEAVVTDIVGELRVHAEIEEAVFYPAIRKALAEGDTLADESLHEHQEVKDTLVEVEGMSAEEAQFEARVTTLINDVRHHVNEEEGEILPKLQRALGELTLQALGEELRAAKEARTSGREPAVLTDVPFPDPETLDEALTTVTLVTPIRSKRQAAPKKTGTRAKRSPATAKRKTSTKKKTASTAPAKATTRAGARTGLVTYHVEPAAGGWKVVKQGATRASATSDAKPGAVARGKELAKRQSRGRLIVHGKDGRIQEQFTYESRSGRD